MRVWCESDTGIGSSSPIGPKEKWNWWAMTRYRKTLSGGEDPKVDTYHGRDLLVISRRPGSAGTTFVVGRHIVEISNSQTHVLSVRSKRLYKVESVFGV